MSASLPAMMAGVRDRIETAWVDPDGTSDGQNSVQVISTGVATVAAANRLRITLPGVVLGRVSFSSRLACDAGGDSAALDFEVSTDGGATYPITGTVVTVSAGQTLVGAVDLLGVYAAAGQCIIRLVTSATETRGGLDVTTATGSAFSTVWNTDNYAVTYAST